MNENILESIVFRTGFFSLTYSAIKQVSFSYPAPNFCLFLSTIPHLTDNNLSEI
jgi:hypothetical protein